jgi:hydrogenase maturation protease
MNRTTSNIERKIVPDLSLYEHTSTTPRCPGISKKRIIVIGLGNEYLCDDGLGIYAVRQLEERIRQISGRENDPEFLSSHAINFEELAIGGLQLLDYLVGYDHCIIIDAIITRLHPTGTIYRFRLEPDTDSVTLTTSHQIDLSQVLTLGRMYINDIPRTVTVYGVEVNDITSFQLSCTDAVKKALPQLVDVIYHNHFSDEETFGVTDGPGSRDDPGSGFSQWEIIRSTLSETF